MLSFARGRVEGTGHVKPKEKKNLSWGMRIVFKYNIGKAFNIEGKCYLSA